MNACQTSGVVSVFLTPDEARRLHAALIRLTQYEDIRVAIELRQHLANTAPAYGGPIEDVPPQ